MCSLKNKLLNYSIVVHKTQPKSCLRRFDQRPSAEEVSYSILLPVLATVRWQSGKNLVVHMTQCVNALVPVNRFFPSFRIQTVPLIHLHGPSVLFPAQYCRL